MKKTGKRFWAALAVFGLMGQVAWVVENMYFNVFIYKIFHASAADISLMVGLSAVTATVTTLLMGAFSDKAGKRKPFICIGYILWGISILAFSFLRPELLEGIAGTAAKAVSLGIGLTILLDCLMTFFGSTANDACFNAWLTEMGDETNRGRIEGINAMMPLISILVVFGGFMAFDLEQVTSWTTIFLIIGAAVIAVGIIGFFLIQDTAPEKSGNQNYFKNIVYCFRKDVILENKLLYAVVGAFAVFGISIQIFMPYLILYYEQSLGMTNYVLIMAPAIIIAAVITAFYGKCYDKMGFKQSVYPVVGMLVVGYLLLYFKRGTAPVFVGSLFMMTGYLSGMAVFGAKIRQEIPENKAGMFQGLRIIGQVLIPGVIGPAIGAFVLRNAEVITGSDGRTSFLPDADIFLAAFFAALALLVALMLVFHMVRCSHRELPTDFVPGELPHDYYPRPSMKREQWICLNGLWDNGIMVPFPPQSVLAWNRTTVLDKVRDFRQHLGGYLEYRKKFTLQPGFVKDKVLLHFGAADQIAEVYVNGSFVGRHEGGYLPFTFSIEEFLQDGENELLVKVTDHLSTRFPYGKQRRLRGGMWYTPVSGIWQSVWLESVPENYIEKLRITPDLTGVDIEIVSRALEFDVILQGENGEIRHHVAGHTFRIEPEKEGLAVHFWTPDNPYLYYFAVETENDRVESYFALRTVEIKEIRGKNRICLNGEPVFLHGVLDQGYYSDGIYLPGSKKGYESDILAMKELGFNTLRKHIKVEPEWFYYLCDKLGMLVMQDMVNSGIYSFWLDTAFPNIGFFRQGPSVPFIDRKRKNFFRRHMKETMETLYNHPCIIYYTIFNEGWGQFDSEKMYDLAKKTDTTRIIDTASGWFVPAKSDVDSRHVYFKAPQLKGGKLPLMLTEFGGFSRILKEHCYSIYGAHGYGFCTSEEELTDRIVDAYEKMVVSSMETGLCGSVYTQLSDVEDEVNGFYTYDRKVCKVDKARIQELGRRIYRTYRETCGRTQAKEDVVCSLTQAGDGGESRETADVTEKM